MTAFETFSEEIREAKRDEDKARRDLLDFYKEQQEQEQQRCKVASTSKTTKTKSNCYQILMNRVNLKRCKVSTLKKDIAEVGFE